MATINITSTTAPKLKFSSPLSKDSLVPLHWPGSWVKPRSAQKQNLESQAQSPQACAGLWDQGSVEGRAGGREGRGSSRSVPRLLAWHGQDSGTKCLSGLDSLQPQIAHFHEQYTFPFS